MRVFNAFQIVLVLVLAPFGIRWLADAEFRGAGVAFWASAILYGIACLFNVFAVSNALKDVDKNW